MSFSDFSFVKILDLRYRISLPNELRADLTYHLECLGLHVISNQLPVSAVPAH